MMRVLIKFFLSLCFFLIRGDDYLTANTIQHCTYSAPEAYLKYPVPDHLSVIRKSLAQANPTTSPGARKEIYKFKATEVEDDDEIPASKKQLKISNNCISFFSTCEPASFHTCFKRPLPFCKHFSYSSSNKFIVHRVIRI